MLPTSHLSSGDLAAYVDGALGRADRDRAEGHLADCDECRAEVVAISRLVGAPRHVQRRRWMIMTSGLAAAAVVVLLSWPGAQERPTTSPVLRANPGEGVTRIDVVAPVVNARATEVVFVWRPAGTAARYQVTLIDVRGTVLWTGATSDTSVAVTLPRVASPLSYWYVDALLPDGRSATSGVRELRPAP